MIVTDLAPYVAGAADLERGEFSITPTRLPLWTRPQHPDRTIAAVALCPAGVRLRLLTAATRITLDARVEQNVSWSQPEPQRAALWLATTGCGPSRQKLARLVVGRPDVLVDEADGGRTLHRGDDAPTILQLGAPADGLPRVVEIWLPHNARVDLRALEADAWIEAAPTDTRARWVHYGSSISQCVNADDPLSSWPAQAATALNADLTSVALSGNAMLDPFVARAIAETPADVITLKLGINIVNAAAMTERTFGPAIHGFLDQIRREQPDVPIVVFTAIACPIHEHTPGPTVWGSDDGQLRGTTSAVPRVGELTLEDARRIVRDVVATRSASDGQLFVAEGPELLGSADVERLYDGLHPDQEGFDLMATRFVDLVRSRSELAEAFRQEIRALG